LLSIFCLLVVFSIPSIRSKIYELFKQGHIVMALAWFGLMFWHIRNLHAAPEFFYAAAGVWACSVIARMVHRNRFMFPLSNVTRGFPTTLEDLPGDMTRVVVTVPPRMSWMPGQHCYISVPGISSLGNHPFTTASIPYPRYDGEVQSHEMVFLVREARGFTKMLGTHAKSFSAVNLADSDPGTLTPLSNTINGKSRSAVSLGSDVDRFPLPPSAVHRESDTTQVEIEITPSPRACSLTVPETPYVRSRSRSQAPSFVSSDEAEAQRAQARVHTWVDGPFGDYQRPLHRHFEGFITISGGSGLTASLPWITYLTNKMRKAADTYDDEDYDCKMRNVTFVWSIRKAEWICWARRELIHALRAASASEGCFRAVIYVTSRDTDQTEAKGMQLDLMLAAGLSEGIDRATVEIRFGRPNIESVLAEFLDRKRNMVRGKWDILCDQCDSAFSKHIAVCGPNALKSGVANAVANLQKLVVRGQVQTISLDSETFGGFMIFLSLSHSEDL
jgi:hypothetical protein